MKIFKHKFFHYRLISNIETFYKCNMIFNKVYKNAIMTNNNKKAVNSLKILIL